MQSMLHPMHNMLNTLTFYFYWNSWEFASWKWNCVVIMLRVELRSKKLDIKSWDIHTVTDVKNSFTSYHTSLDVFSWKQFAPNFTCSIKFIKFFSAFLQNWVGYQCQFGLNVNGVSSAMILDDFFSKQLCT